MVDPDFIFPTLNSGLTIAVLFLQSLTIKHSLKRICKVGLKVEDRLDNR